MIIAIVGPTASGKSDLGIALARRFNGEIVNCDSVQAYRGINIATAKVPPEQQQGIPHHLIDIVEPTYTLTAVEWAERARQVIESIEARGKRAFLVGGTGFYLKALTMRFFDAPEIDPSLRPRLQKLLDHHGPEYLHRMLKRVDPKSAAQTEPRNRSRTTRALEVYFSSGRPLSDWQAEAPVEPTAYFDQIFYLVLKPPRQELYARINLRVDVMVQSGLLKEIEDLIASGIPPTAKAFQAHGYKRFVEYLLGQRTLESAIEQMKLDTRHYAKRQWTWWRAQSNTFWLDGFGFDERIIQEAAGIVETLFAENP
ncbi:MAG: tRNA (adenosine(37)-N6)-dimethylallyltransferase MiaA [Acidobacteria bacterium]|nr:tRNA (adenosine(37)-N6)-dimethylallyltransferase MiaA [Acidobacteriota bacterium]